MSSESLSASHTLPLLDGARPALIVSSMIAFVFILPCSHHFEAFEVMMVGEPLRVAYRTVGESRVHTDRGKRLGFVCPPRFSLPISSKHSNI